MMKKNLKMVIELAGWGFKMRVCPGLIGRVVVEQIGGIMYRFKKITSLLYLRDWHLLIIIRHSYWQKNF